MFHSAKPLFAALAITLASSLAGNCSTITTITYNNGSPNQADGADISEFIAADDFVLKANSVITGATFWASANVDPFTSQFSGTVGVGIFSNNGGEPGSLIASSSDNKPTLTDTGIQIFGTEEYKIDVTLPPLSLTAGSYWLGLHENALGTLDDGTSIYWDTTGNQTGALPMSTSDLSGSSGWYQGLYEDNLDLAFELSGTQNVSSAAPEPRTFLPLLLLGLGGLVLHKRSVN